MNEDTHGQVLPSYLMAACVKLRLADKCRHGIRAPDLHN
jgi:hypothetical protein